MRHRRARSVEASVPFRPVRRAASLVAAVAVVLALPGPPALAGEADVVGVTVTALGGERFRIDATVAHADEGWDHYADRWTVLDERGASLGVRELAHPHENEQPFTRSVTVAIPAGVERIEVRAHDSVHGEGGESFFADVPR